MATVGVIKEKSKFKYVLVLLFMNIEFLGMKKAKL